MCMNEQELVLYKPKRRIIDRVQVLQTAHAAAESDSARAMVPDVVAAAQHEHEVRVPTPEQHEAAASATATMAPPVVQPRDVPVSHAARPRRKRRVMPGTGAPAGVVSAQRHRDMSSDKVMFRQLALRLGTDRAQALLSRLVADALG